MAEIHYLKHGWGDPGFWTGMLLIRGKKTSFLLDTAVNGAVEETLEPYFKKHHIEWRSVSHIINTHFHSDHVECNALIQNLSGAETAIHHAGAENLRKTGSPVNIELKDGDIIAQDDLSLRIIHTPGHSADSICILEEDTGTLFSGDSIQGKGSENIGFALYDDHAAYRESLQKLRRLCRKGDIRRLITGHPERPLNGIAEQGELLSFLDISLQTADDYMRIAEEFLQLNPDSGEDCLQQFLLGKLGCRTGSKWNHLALIVSRALLNMFP